MTVGASTRASVLVGSNGSVIPVETTWLFDSAYSTHFQFMLSIGPGRIGETSVHLLSWVGFAPAGQLAARQISFQAPRRGECDYLSRGF